MTAQMSRLEWLGMHLAFRDLLRLTHGEAAILTHIIKKAPAVACYRGLEAAARNASYHRVETPTVSAVDLTKVYMHSVRSHIGDLVMHTRLAGVDTGFSFKIETVRNSGYRMSEADAAALIEVAKNHVAGCSEVAA